MNKKQSNVFTYSSAVFLLLAMPWTSGVLASQGTEGAVEEKQDGVEEANLTAIASNGRQVILRPNGTWIYSKISANSGSGDFRKSSWGDSKSDVVKVEGDPLVEKADDHMYIVMYMGSVKGIQSMIGYIFVEDKLVRTKYVPTVKHTNDTDYLTVDYATLKKGLDNKYGPGDENYIWKNDLYKSDRSRWGMALSVGHLMVGTFWKTPETSIYLGVSGDNYKVNLQLEYTSLALKEFETNAKERIQEDEL